MTTGTRKLGMLTATIFVLAGAVAVGGYFTLVWAGQPDAGARTSAQQKKTFAQKIVDDAAAKHHELAGLELEATPAGKQVCEAIASTEAKDIGEKCDEDEFTAMKTGKPVVDKEKDEWDITLPLHDAGGKLIGALGMDFQAKPGQEQSTVVHLAEGIAGEIEKQIPSSVRLFEPEN